MTCRICDNEKGNTDYEAREMMFGYRDVFAYFQCAACGCLQIRDMPADMSRYYPDTYYSYQSATPRNAFSNAVATLRDGYALTGKGLLGRLIYARFPRVELHSLSRLNVNKETRILDVGCGAGTLLSTLQKQGMTRLLGIDPFNAHDIEQAGGLRILKKEIHDVEGEWDVVMLHHSLEHIVDQAAVMKSAAALLAPGGCCMVRIPVVSSYAWKHYSTNWVQLDAPRHLFLHSAESMSILAGHAGLSVDTIVYDSTAFQFWGSEQYLRDIPLRDEASYLQNPQASGFSSKDIAVFAKRARELNAAGQG